MTRGARIRVTTLHTLRHTPWADCGSCQWEITAGQDRSWPAVREAARRHAAHNGHVVTAEYRMVHTYGVTATGPDPAATAPYIVGWGGDHMPDDRQP